MKIDPLNLGAILIALIAALGAWLTHRQTAKATIVSAKSAAEMEAYGRAVNMDRETIKRQDGEIEKLREENDKLKKRVKTLEDDYDKLHSEHRKLRLRMTAIEGIPKEEHHDR